MCVYILHSGIHDVIDEVHSRLFWDKDKLKYHVVKWSTMCSPKDNGGLGFMNTRLVNLCLMAKMGLESSE
jgi:hypothetical protein